MNNNMLIQEYQSSWESDFTTLKKVIHEALKETEIRIEHVGSTAVKDLAAKSIIDIDIIYEKNVSFEKVKKGLEKIGYYHNGDQGIEGREVFKRDKQIKSHVVLDSIPHHLYACQPDCEELKKHLIFRNFLRENEKERKEYEDLKHEIAIRANQDRKKYAQLKEAMASAFVESIIDKVINRKNKTRPNIYDL